MENELAMKLAAANDAYRNATGEDNPPPPDGQYVVRVVECKPTITKKGDLCLVTEFVTIGGNEAGRQWGTWHLLDESQRKRMWWAKQHLEKLGVVCEDLTQIQQHLLPVIGKAFSVQVETTDSNGRQYTNTTVLGAVTDAGVATVAATPVGGGVPIDAVPF